MLIKNTIIALALRSVLTLASTLVTCAAFSAQIAPSDYAKLLSEAGKSGFTRVLVTLDDTVTLEAMRNNLPAVRSAMEHKAKMLLSELGQEALDTGYWNNGIGQIGVYLNTNGLRMLMNSANAKAFMPDVTHKYRIQAHDADGSLDAIENVINASGFANIVVTLNIDGDYDIARDGTTTFRASPTISSDIAARLGRINTQGFASGFRNLDTAELQSGRPNPDFKVQIDRKAFYALRESSDVRAIRLVGFKDSRQAQWSPNALSAAKTNGSADVVITLRGGAAFSPKSGFMSANAWKAQENANSRVIDDLLTSAGASTASSVTVSHAGLGSVQVLLSYQALARLYASADPRVLSVSLNRPAANASLTNSTVLLNMQSAWNAGYRAAGQNIIVIDSGVRKDHELFKMNGAIKVIYEACFGSNGGSYSSICPSADALGDSPLGLAGSGEPFSNLAVCAALQTAMHDCSHGTHVAGISAGRSSLLVSPTNLQGVALDASLIAVQVFSYDTTNVKAIVFSADILAALNAVYAATVPGFGNPYVMNMSLGGGIYPADCSSVDPAVTNAIQNLTSRGVPVVVATGNNGNKNGIAWPSCVPQTIKVASVQNDAMGTTLSSFSNVGNPQNFTGPILLTPGGGGGTAVNSADRASTSATKAMQGTSMAAPHAAGVYAAIKAGVPGISVADATAWIVTTGSFAVSYALPAPVGSQTFRRIRIPTL